MNTQNNQFHFFNRMLNRLLSGTDKSESSPVSASSRKEKVIAIATARTVKKECIDSAPLEEREVSERCAEVEQHCDSDIHLQPFASGSLSPDYQSLYDQHRTRVSHQLMTPDERIFWRGEKRELKPREKVESLIRNSEQKVQQLSGRISELESWLNRLPISDKSSHQYIEWSAELSASRDVLEHYHVFVKDYNAYKKRSITWSHKAQSFELELEHAYLKQEHEKINSLHHELKKVQQKLSQNKAWIESYQDAGVLSIYSTKNANLAFLNTAMEANQRVALDAGING